jgi:hypothetical protein
MKLQVSLEDSYIDIGKMAQKGQDIVILMDRGLMDGSAYITNDLWESLLDEMGVNVVQIRDNRYDAIIHMATAADGAKEYFGT